MLCKNIILYDKYDLYVRRQPLYPHNQTYIKITLHMSMCNNKSVNVIIFSLPFPPPSPPRLYLFYPQTLRRSRLRIRRTSHRAIIRTPISTKSPPYVRPLQRPRFRDSSGSLAWFPNYNTPFTYAPKLRSQLRRAIIWPWFGRVRYTLRWMHRLFREVIALNVWVWKALLGSFNMICYFVVFTSNVVRIRQWSLFCLHQ